MEKLFAENLELKNELMAFKHEVAALRAQVDWLKRQVFGPGKSETLDRLQTVLALEETAKAQAPAKTETITYERKVAAKEKRPLPAETFKDLPVAETIEIIPDEVKAQPELYEKISEEKTFDEARQREDGLRVGAGPGAKLRGEASGCPSGSEANKSTSSPRNWSSA